MSEYTIIDNKKNLWNPSIVFLVFGTRVSCSSGRPMHFLPKLEEEEGFISIFLSIREWLFQEIILIAVLNKLNLKLNWTDGNYDHDILKSWLECVLYFDNLSKMRLPWAWTDGPTYRGQADAYPHSQWSPSWDWSKLPPVIINDHHCPCLRTSPGGGTWCPFKDFQIHWWQGAFKGFQNKLTPTLCTM